MTATNTTSREYVFPDRRFFVGPIMLRLSRIVTTLVVAVVAATIWHRSGRDTVGQISRIISVGIFADVLLTPTLIARREKRTGKKVEWSVYADNGYGWLWLCCCCSFTSG
jgi:hypothetical protein